MVCPEHFLQCRWTQGAHECSFTIKQAFSLKTLSEQLSLMVQALVLAQRTLRSKQVLCSQTLYKRTKKGIIFSNRLKISEGENNSSALELQVQETSSSLSHRKHLRKVQRQLSHWTSFTYFGSFAVF